MSDQADDRNSTSAVHLGNREINSVYQIRMNEYCLNYLDQTSITSRPKPSISPIESLQTDSFLVPEVQSPFVGPKVPQLESSQAFGSSPSLPFFGKQFPLNKNLLGVKEDFKMVLFQSTPNRSVNCDSNIEKNHLFNTSVPRVNFHSIHDLAKSSNKSSSSLSDESSRTTSLSSLSSSILSETASSGYASSLHPSLTFNESLKNLSESLMANKENFESQIAGQKIKRKPRTTISKQQKAILDHAYKIKPYPDSNEVEYLCQLLGFEEHVIRIWFQNKRARNKQTKN